MIKSTELLKFYVYDYYYVFLPLNKRDLSFQFNELRPHAQRFYLKINEIYMTNKKATTKHDSLMENLNRWSKLINDRQKAPIKVVYNNSGSTLNSAVIQGEYLITGDLSFFDTDNLKEAYYLSAVLNSSIIENQIKIKKSSRHIFKLPFETDIRRFNPLKKTHQKLADLGKESEIIVKKKISEINRNKSQLPSKFKLQKIIFKEIKKQLKEIDELVLKDLTD
ncbi:MAG: hypothetical protein GF383_05450 [Candidatus Lokiarchaeota archaeon]|nr:hypothetical protein [Candidatus Lokiarchaeota archaeon]